MFKFLRKTALWILLAPWVITGVGITSNQAVLWANQDKFPVKWNDYKVNAYALSLREAANSQFPVVALKAQFDLEALEEEGFIDDTHCLMTDQTHLNWLADVWDFHDETDSIGDILLDLGGWLAAFSPFVWGAVVIGKLKKD